MGTKYDTVTKTIKALDLSLKAGKIKKSVLTSEWLDRAVDDAVKGCIVNRRSKAAKSGDPALLEHHNNWMAFDRLSNIKKIVDMVDSLQESIKHLSNGQMDKDMWKSASGAVEHLDKAMDTLEMVAEYTKLVRQLDSYVFWFANVLENKYAREGRTETELQAARDACKAIGLPFDEEKSKIDWAPREGRP